MTSSDKLNQNSKEKISDEQRLKILLLIQE